MILTNLATLMFAVHTVPLRITVLKVSLYKESSVKKLYKHKSGHLDSPSLQKPDFIRVFMFSGRKRGTMTPVVICFHSDFWEVWISRVRILYVKQTHF